MSSGKSILVVDDSAINRKILNKILSDSYQVTEAANGKEALALLGDAQQDIFGIMLDLMMPVMDGYTFLQKVAENPDYKSIPIIVTTENSDNENEIKALKLGAWDFVSKPYHPEIIKFRLKNAIDRSQLSAFHQLKYLAEYDALTGIYNKSKFYECTWEMLQTHMEISFAFIRFDIDRFQLINSFFGMNEGDKLLCFIAESIQNAIHPCPFYTYGRMESDVFSFCIPYEKESAEHIIETIREALTKYNPNYDIVPSFGIYVIEDNAMEVETMFNYASLAAKLCKSSYIEFLAYYTEDLSETLMREQEITNEMNVALEEEQFKIYLQPKYNLQTNQPAGAEALVRWTHPQKGVISPGEFIPLFERNGFIIKLDYYVWEKACKLLRKWLDTMENVFPISVNVSRVNIYNPNIADVIINLVEKYEIPPQYLNLELTESAYTDNPMAMKEIIKKLQNYGFTILMDDFGSGYSSLNILKDISVDVLKLDMLFLTDTDIEGRGENIIASVIRMAKWLNIPVIVEGVEKREQVVFLRSIGCDYVQGYYFAKPMTVSDYDILIAKNERVVRSSMFDASVDFTAESLFKSNPQMEMLFSDLVQAIVIFEFDGNRPEVLRVNEGFYDLMGPNDTAIKSENPIEMIVSEHQEAVLEAFRSVVRTKETAVCTYLRKKNDGSHIWIQAKLKYIQQMREDSLVFGTLQDITAQKEIDMELNRLRAALSQDSQRQKTILIVDDIEMNREILKEIFKDDFLVLEAENGSEAIAVLESQKDTVDIILLDLQMPVMDGKEFLAYQKANEEWSNIPVIIITAEDSRDMQVQTLSLGASDYIVKPFVSEIVVKRVNNIIGSNRKINQVIQEYKNVSKRGEFDLLADLYNYNTAQECVNALLAKKIDGIHALIAINFDHFKKINKAYGYGFGNQMLRYLAKFIKEYFRSEDIVARANGEEFIIFMPNVKDDTAVKKYCDDFRLKLSNSPFHDESPNPTCTIGIAICPQNGNDFKGLWESAGSALQQGKQKGGNQCRIYREDDVGTLENSNKD